jgi:RNA polymerase sigma-70 factor (ECF subfamily)
MERYPVQQTSTGCGGTDANRAHAQAGEANAARATDQRLAALMRAAQAGDRVAYAVLLRELVPLLRRLVQSRARFLQRADHDDLIQEVLLSLHCARATYQADRPFIPWLVCIAQRRIADRARRHARRRANEARLAESVPALPDAASHPADRYGDPRALQQAVSGLPTAQRNAIELLKLRELTLKEVANLTGRNPGALRVSVHRAIKRLRVALT